MYTLNPADLVSCLFNSKIAYDLGYVCSYTFSSSGFSVKAYDIARGEMDLNVIGDDVDDAFEILLSEIEKLGPTINQYSIQNNEPFYPKLLPYICTVINMLVQNGLEVEISLTATGQTYSYVWTESASEVGPACTTRDHWELHDVARELHEWSEKYLFKCNELLQN